MGRYIEMLKIKHALYLARVSKRISTCTNYLKVFFINKKLLISYNNPLLFFVKFTYLLMGYKLVVTHAQGFYVNFKLNFDLKKNQIRYEDQRMFVLSWFY